MYFEYILKNIRNIFIPDIFMIIYLISFIVIYIGMLNPVWVLGEFNVRQTRSRVLLIYGSICIVSLVINFLISD